MDSLYMKCQRFVLLQSEAETPDSSGQLWPSLAGTASVQRLQELPK